MTPHPESHVLKPCPFCGGESFIQRYESGHDEPNVSWIVNCKSCHARTQSLEEEQTDAIENWNRRSARQEAAAPREEPVASQAALINEIMDARQKRAEALHDMLFDAREIVRAKLNPQSSADERAIFDKLHAALYVLRGDPFDMHMRAALTGGGK